MATTWYMADTEEAQERLVGAWPDAPLENLEVCEMLLETAQEQVIAYARESDVLDDDGGALDSIPRRLIYAQLKHAENLWNAGRVSSAGDVGMDGGYTFTPRPLDKTIRGIIRPIDGRPHAL